MPPLWLVTVLLKITEGEKWAFWHRLYLEIWEELELGPPPPNIQLEEVGQQVPWGLEVQPVW